MQQIQPSELFDWLAEEPPLLLDVREPWEVALCVLPRSVHVPMRDIPARIGELDGSRPVVCLCHHGGRSMQVAIFLESRGFTNVYNLAGGLDAWARQIDPTFTRY